MPGLSAEESERMQAAFKDIAERSQKLLQDFAERYKAEGPGPADPLHLTGLLHGNHRQDAGRSRRLMAAQMELWQEYMELWQDTAQRMLGRRPSRWSSRQGRQALPRRGVDGRCRLRL